MEGVTLVSQDAAQVGLAQRKPTGAQRPARCARNDGDGDGARFAIARLKAVAIQRGTGGDMDCRASLAAAVIRGLLIGMALQFQPGQFDGLVQQVIFIFRVQTAR